MLSTAPRLITEPARDRAFILWFDEVSIADIPLVGGKNASLGEMIQQLAPKGVNVPNGFATTAAAYRYFIAQAGLDPKLHQIFADLDVDNLQNLRQRGEQARSLMLNTPFPPELELEIATAYTRLCSLYGGDGADCDLLAPIHPNLVEDCLHNTDVAVRSSATAEDLPDASFAGQQETYLNVHGVKQVIDACHKCFASIFTDRAISYRTARGFDHLNVYLSVGVQKMVRSDLAASGVMFSIDPETGFRNAASIGSAVGERIGQGQARVVFDVHQIAEFQPGEVLVTNKTDPDWEPIMKKAGAIVTNQGGRTCHAAIIAREMGIPAIVGCSDATSAVATGQAVTVSCAEGDIGRVYDGLLTFEVIETELSQLPATHTQILMNVGNPAEALGLAAIPCDGVGLARLEFIIANQIKVHPLALLNFDLLTDANVKREIAKLTVNYLHKPDFFVDKLAHGIATIAAAFYPRPVIVRMSDFKSNGHKIGICGQAPSDYPEFARFLVAQGIDSISLNPDSVIKTRLEIARVEASLKEICGRSAYSRHP